MAISNARLEKNKELYMWLRRTSKDSGAKQAVDAIDRIIKQNLPYPTYDSMMRWIYKMQLENRKGGYINDYIKYTRKYNEFLIDTGKPHDPRIKDIKMVRETPPTKSTMSDEEIEAFLSLPPQVHKKTVNGKVYDFHYDKGYELYSVFFACLAFSGARPSEIANLKIEDVDFGRNVFILSETKTNTPRNVPISPNLIEMLKKHMSDKTDYLFPSDRSSTGVITAMGWGHQFQKRVERMGIKRTNLTCYSLRHSFVTRMLESDLNIYKVQKIVGHKSVLTTEAYTHLTTKDIQKAIQKDPLFIKNNPEGKLKYLKDLLTGLLLDNTSDVYLNIEDTPTSVKFEARIKNEPS